MSRRVGTRTIEKDARRLRVLMGGTTTTTIGTHDILSATHSDSTAAAVVDGDVIIGYGTEDLSPKWTRLAISVPAANVHNYLGVDNGETRPSWKSGSSNPGAASGILASDANGYVQVTGLGITAAPASNDLHIGTGQGITHADGVAAGNFLRANGTRYVPDTLDIDDVTDLAYAVPNLTLTTANAAGVANTVIRSDASVAIFDVNVPTTIQPDDAAAAGVAAFSARRDHTHAITCDTPVNIAPDDAAAEGTAYNFARSDHTHGFTCAAPTTDLSVSTANAEGAGTEFVRDSHTHAITSSSNPGAAASILASSAAGALTLVDLTLSSLTASTAIYADAAKKIVSLANAAGYLENDGAGGLSWAAGVPPAAHDILSASHGDTAAAAVTDGDIIIGNVTPEWSELAISVPAANVRNVLGVDNGETRPSWKTALDNTNPVTLTVATAAAPGTSLFFSHRDHAHAVTSSSNPGAAASLLASDANGYLQLVGAGIGAAPASADLHFATGVGITHADGVAAGQFLRANGTRYIPDTLDISDITDLAYAVPNLTLTTVNAAGAADTVIRSDASILVFDAVVPNTIECDDAAAVGVATVAARRDHEHAIVCAIAGNIAPDDAAAEGSAVSFARSDHTHGFTCAAPSTNLSVSSTNAEGAGTQFVRESHTHAIDSSANPGAAASLLATTAAGLLTLVQLDTDTISDRSGGNLTISPTGDIILNPTGNDILPTTNWDLTFGSVSKKYVDLHLGELTAGHIVADDTASGIAGRVLLAPMTLFAVDLASGTTNSAEKLSNIGFETAGGGGADVFANWSESAGDGTIGQDAVVFHGGTKSCKLTSGATSNTYVYQDIVVADTDQIIWGFWVYGDGTNPGRYRVYDNTNAADIIAVASTGVTAAAWTKVWIDFDVPNNCVSARLYFYCPAVNTAFAYFDDTTAKTGVQITVTDDDLIDVDIAYAEAGGNVEWFEIASAAGGAGPYTYWVERDLDGGGANDWYAGDALGNTGAQTDEGYIDIYSVDSILGTTTNGASILGGLRESPTYNDVDEIWQLSGALGLNFLARLDTDPMDHISWYETNFAGDRIARIGTSWDGGAADNLTLWAIAVKPTGLSAGDAIVNIGARDIDGSEEGWIALEQSGQLSLGPDLGPIVNANMTIGLCINQDTNDDEIGCFKASEVAHGGTTLANTDVFGLFKKVEGAAGGLLVEGLKDADGGNYAALDLRGELAENVDTTKGTGGIGIVTIEGFQISGTGWGNTVDNGNVLSVRTRRGGAVVTVMILDEDGDLHLDAGAGDGGTGAWAFDEYDDLALLTGLRASTAPKGHELRERSREFIEYARPILEATGVVNYGEDRHFVSMRGLQYLTIDALRQFCDLTVGELRQLKEQCKQYERAFKALGVNPMKEVEA